MAPDVLIGDLRIRLPGLPAEHARSFASEVAKMVSEGLPSPQRTGDLGQVKVRVSVPEGSSYAALKASVAQAIREALA
jgi:hypothetical protein